MVDPFMGVINIVKINSGVLTNGMEVAITNKGDKKKFQTYSSYVVRHK